MTEGGFNADKLHTLCNFVNPDFISNLVAETDRRPYCVYVGRLSHEKGVATLIDAISSLPYALKLIGTGPLENELREKAQGKNIEFLGSLPPEEVRRHVAKARLLILPSEWYENNPLSIIEALCLGTPAIALSHAVSRNGVAPAFQAPHGVSHIRRWSDSGGNAMGARHARPLWRESHLFLRRR